MKRLLLSARLVAWALFLCLALLGSQRWGAPPIAQAVTETAPAQNENEQPQALPAQTNTNTVLAVFVLALDNDLTSYYTQTLAAVVTGTLGQPTKTAVLLVDRDGPADTQILVVTNGVSTTVVGLPNATGRLDTTIKEYNVADGDQLGGFLLWARTTYTHDVHLLTILGHGLPLVPSQASLDATQMFTRVFAADAAQPKVFALPSRQAGATKSVATDTATSQSQRFLPLPSRWDAHPSFSDQHPGALFSPTHLAKALDISMPNNAEKWRVVNLIQCFAATIETLYELAPYADITIAAPGYTYLNPTDLGEWLQALDTSLSLINWTSNIANEQLFSVWADDQPNKIMWVNNAGMDAFKAQWNTFVEELWARWQDDPDHVRTALRTAARRVAHYDTTYCHRDLQMEPRDGLVDLFTFLDALRNSFAAEDADFQETLATLATLARQLGDGGGWSGQPWFVPAPAPFWALDYTQGLALYADFIGTPIGDHYELSWISRWYTNTTTADNPQPLRFLAADPEGKVTWAQIIQAYWQGEKLVAPSICAPAIPPFGEHLMVSAGGNHSCRLGTNGVVSCWGSNFDSPLPFTTTFSQISAGETHTCGVNGQGVTCWVGGEDLPTSVPQGPIYQISASRNHNCINYPGASSGGIRPFRIACWDRNATQRITRTEEFRQVSAGAEQACGLTMDYTVICWDKNNQIIPLTTTLATVGNTFLRITNGAYHTCGQRLNNQWFCWGDNQYKQSEAPTEPMMFVSAGQWHNCGLRLNGTILCWGRNDQGQAPTLALTPDGVFTQISAGGEHTCAIRQDDAVVCWGNNAQGQAPTLTLTPTTTVPGSLRQRYQLPLAVVDQRRSSYRAPTPAFRLISGALPPGVTLITSTGMISGTPTALGQFAFTVQANDANGMRAEHTYLLPVQTADQIFADGFETGGLAAWSKAIQRGGVFSLTTDAPPVGRHALAVQLQATTPIYLQDDSPVAETRYRARFYLHPQSLAMNANATHVLFYGYQQAGPATPVVRIELRYADNSYQVRAAVRTDGNTWRAGRWRPLTVAWHALEIDWLAATAPGANNGRLTFWVDGVRQQVLTGVDNDTRRIDLIRWGAVAGIDAGTVGSFGLDDFVARRNRSIGLADSTTLALAATPADEAPGEDDLPAAITAFTEEAFLPEELDEPAAFYTLYLPWIGR